MATNYRDYATDEVSNRGLIPEGGYSGPRVNNDLRNLGAAVRNLGDETPKIGAGMTGETKIGTAALRDETYFVRAGASTGGTSGNFGMVPVGGVVPFFGSLSAAEALLASGFVVCDGRRVLHPVTGAAFDAPDFREGFLRFFGNAVSPGSSGGSATVSGTISVTGATNLAGAVAAGVTGDGGGGSTGGTSLDPDDVPGISVTGGAIPPGGAGGSLLIADAGAYGDGTPRRLVSLALSAATHAHTVGAHNHTVPAIPTHTHTVAASGPLSAPLVPIYKGACIPLLRIA